jgi:hypothetical protein
MFIAGVTTIGVEFRLIVAIEDWARHPADHPHAQHADPVSP